MKPHLFPLFPEHAFSLIKRLSGQLFHRTELQHAGHAMLDTGWLQSFFDTWSTEKAYLGENRIISYIEFA
jgi:hypothetical protein